MISSFVNYSVRSAGDLLADLTACRQLRHAPRDGLVSLVDEHFAQRPSRYVRGEIAFQAAFVQFGYCCDICADIVGPIDVEIAHKVAARALDNLDGRVKLMLCLECSKSFQCFCATTFGREARQLYTPELEQMMIAFIARELSLRCGRVMAGHPSEPPKAEMDDRNLGYLTRFIA